MTRDDAIRAAQEYLRQQQIAVVDIQSPSATWLSTDQIAAIYAECNQPPIQITDWWAVRFPVIPHRFESDAALVVCVRDADGHCQLE